MIRRLVFLIGVFSLVFAGIKKARIDHREYRHILLPNQMEAILISDSSATKAAAALEVGVGSLFDTPELQGLAHFLEHMLFMGSMKFPKENDFTSYLAKHGGMTNAFTADSRTSYFFSVDPQNFEQAIDMFAQFFISPLLTDSAIERELDAVHSEYSMGIQADSRRECQVTLYSLYNHGHPIHHFGCGNRETLRDVSRQVLVNFYNAWYSANIMKLAIIGRETLDDLEKMIRSLFSHVPNKNVQIPRGYEFGHSEFLNDRQVAVSVGSVARKTPYGNDDAAVFTPSLDFKNLQKLTFIVPIESRNSIIFQWVMPEQERMWRSKPLRYLNYILNHEGNGSLAQVLKERGWATALSTALSEQGTGGTVYRISLGINQRMSSRILNEMSSKEEEGEISGSRTLLGEIAVMLATYIRMIKMEISENIWKEIQDIDRLAFDYTPLTDPLQTVVDLAHGLDLYPFEEVMTAKKLMYEYDEVEIINHLNILNSDNLTMIVVGKSFVHLCTETEKWYGTKYGTFDIPKQVIDVMNVIERMSDEEFRVLRQNRSLIKLSMPSRNEFLPEKFDIISSQFETLEKSAPQLVFKSLQTYLWFKQVTSFKIPTVQAKFAIYSPELQVLRSASIASLFADLINEELNPVKHAASLAGSRIKVISLDERFIIEVDGFSDKIGKILEVVLEKIGKIKISREEFYHVRSSPSVTKCGVQPYEQAKDLLNQVLYQTYFTCADQLNDISEITFEEFIVGLKDSRGNGLVLESLIEGNLMITEAIQMHEFVSAAFGFGKKEKKVLKVGVGVAVMKLDGDVRIARQNLNPSEKNGAVIVSVETGWMSAFVNDSDQADLETDGYLTVVSQIIGENFFDNLRTKQQLGYIVRASKFLQGRRAGLVFMVQSQKPTAIVEERIMQFISYIPDIIESMSDEDFKKYIAAVLSDLKAQPTKLADAFSKDWLEMKRRRFDFVRNDRIIPVVESITKNELIKYVVEKIIRAPKAIAMVAGSQETDFTDKLNQEELQALKLDKQTKWIYSNTNPVIE